jgi:urea transport system substrate-binding protein
MALVPLALALAFLPFVPAGCSKKEGGGGGGGGVSGNTVKVGILHSLTGTMAISEKSLKDAELMAIEEINNAGGVQVGDKKLKIDPIVEDPQSKFTDVFPEKARKLLLKDNVACVFGCWTSVSRQNVLPVFEKENGLLFYPVQYEGNECSKNVVYTGAAPNQQIEPAVKWLLEKGYKKFYLLGSNYVFPRTANLIIVKYIDKFGKGAKVVAEEYTELGWTKYESVVQNIIKAKPDVIFSTINGDSNTNFYKELAAQGITAGDVTKPGASEKQIPVIAVSVGEDELRDLNPSEVKGHLAAWNYFESQKNPENLEFVKKFKDKYGKDRVTDDPIAAAYAQVYYWKLAVEKAKSTDVDKVREAVRGVEFNAPEGHVKVDPKTQHVYKYFRLGRIRDDRQFDILYETPQWIEPDPYPDFAFPGWRCDWTKGGVKRGADVKIGTK